MDEPVRTVDGDELRYLLHRETIHGAQYRDARRRYPVPYYLSPGPLDEVFAFADRGDGARRVAIVGLGTGALAARGDRGDAFVFYETSPVVAECARREFTYLEMSDADVEVRLEEGRQGLVDGDRPRDLVVVDAFLGDAFPLHLATREALEGYRASAGEGVGMLINVSISHVSLAPRIAATAEALGWRAWQTTHRPDADDERREEGGRLFWDATDWVFLLADDDAIRRFEARQSGWRRPSVAGDEPLVDDLVDRIPRVR